MGKRFTMMLIVFILVIQCVGYVSASDEVTRTCGDFTYTVVNGTATLTAYKGTATEIEIPETVDEYLVTALGDNLFENNETLLNVTMPESIVSIGEKTFYGCSGLKKVVLPQSLTFIDSYAFAKCTGFTSLELPENLETVKSCAFYDCDNLMNVTLNGYMNDLSSDIFTSTPVSNLHISKNAKSINEAFLCDDTKSLKTITVDEENTAYCAVDDILFNKDMTILYRYPFKKGGESYEIPEGVVELGKYAFCYCDYLKGLTFPKSLTTIGEESLYNCEVESITINGNITDIHENVNEFFYMDTKQVYLGPEVSVLDDSIRDMDTLQKFTVDAQNTVFSAGEDGVLMKNEAILYRYPKGKTDTSYAIPDTIREIGEEAFANCTLLTKIKLKSLIYTVAEDAFSNCRFTELALGSGVTELNEALAGLSMLTAITADSDSGAFTSVDGVLFSKDKTRLYRYPVGKSEASYAIPDTVTAVGDYAFKDTKLTSITLSSNLKCIGDYAFYECSGITGDLNFENAISIGEYAFYNCDGIGELHFIGNAPTMKETSFGDVATVLYYDGDTDGWFDVMETFSQGNVLMIEKGDCQRAIALVLDCSASMTGEPLTELKASAKQFCEDVLTGDVKTQIVLIDYATHAASYGFTSGIEGLNKKIDVLSASGQTNLYEAMEKADAYLETITADEKDMIIMADGMPQYGKSSRTGPFTQADIGGYYLFANAVYNLFESLDAGYRIFSMGFFHSLDTEEYAFANKFINMIQRNGYRQVDAVDKLLGAFETVAEVVIDPSKEDLLNPILPEAPTTEEVPSTTEASTTGNVPPTTEASTTGNVPPTTEASTTGNVPPTTEAPPADNEQTVVKPEKKKYAKKNKTYKVGKLKYRVTKASKTGKGTVSFAGPTKKNVTLIKIPTYVRIYGVKYKVTGIHTKAFYGCKRLKKIKISSTYIKSVGKKAFSSMYKKVKIDVPKKKVKAYKKMFKKRGLSSKARVY